jgi:ribosomal protein S27AE
MSLTAARKCPRCSAQLVIIKRWFGLSGTFPRECAHCGTGLLYDTVGGVYVRTDSKS